MMLAAVCHRLGPPEDLVFEVFDDLVPRPGHAVIEVHAAAINFPDVLIMAGAYQVSVPVPFIPGSELAGVVVSLGAGVTTFAPGDRVFATVGTGAFAEQVEVPVALLEPVPAGVGLVAAAAFGVAYLTSYHALRSVAAVLPGEQVVVLGAAGGVGLAAVDIARSLGATVTAAASSREKLALCRRRGASHLIDYAAEDLRLRIRQVTDGGADVVIDPVGGPWSEAALRSTRWGGRFVTLGFASGTIPSIPLNLVLLKGVVVKGLDVRTFAVHEPVLAARDRRELLALLASGSIAPYVGATYPLGNLAEALRCVADRQALGKVVVVMRF